MSTTSPEDEQARRTSGGAIHVRLPERYYLLPGAAIITGTILGLKRGSRKASLRFLAENVHRPPTTVQGWYFYNKTKNYKVMLGGLKEAGTESLKLGSMALVFLGIDEGCRRLGWDEVKEVAAATGTAGAYAALYRLPMQGTRRMLGAGLMMGMVLKGLEWSQSRMKEQARVRSAEAEIDVVDGGSGTVDRI